VRITSLGSGSRGNSTLIEDENSCILVDLGFTLKEIERRLHRIGRTPQDISGVLVTHEHSDHIKGVGAFSRKHKTAVYLTPCTYSAKLMGDVPNLNRINCHRPFEVGSLSIEPVAVPHDAREPCQYVISSGRVTIGVLTDLGHITPHVERHYEHCDALLLECNHDLQMLSDGPYPYALRQRVGGMRGHLNNQQAAGLLQKIDLPRLQHLVISHISEKNNANHLALGAVNEVLQADASGWQGRLQIAEQDTGFDWLDISPA
jgi:phosphoribosyl 1,2-cyclic phosphodiesterase